MPEPFTLRISPHLFPVDPVPFPFLCPQSLEEQSKKMDLITATAIHRFGGQEAPGSVKEILEAMEDTSTLYAVPCMGVMGSHTYAMPITVKEKEVRTHRGPSHCVRHIIPLRRWFGSPFSDPLVPFVVYVYSSSSSVAALHRCVGC
jgi:hypothetical protein